LRRVAYLGCGKLLGINPDYGEVTKRVSAAGFGGESSAIV
jgi:hypothetical protein